MTGPGVTAFRAPAWYFGSGAAMLGISLLGLVQELASTTTPSKAAIAYAGISVLAVAALVDAWVSTVRIEGTSGRGSERDL